MKFLSFTPITKEYWTNTILLMECDETMVNIGKTRGKTLWKVGSQVPCAKEANLSEHISLLLQYFNVGYTPFPVQVDNRQIALDYLSVEIG